jgi:hypothetical protein
MDVGLELGQALRRESVDMVWVRLGKPIAYS